MPLPNERNMYIGQKYDRRLIGDNVHYPFKHSVLKNTAVNCHEIADESVEMFHLSLSNYLTNNAPWQHSAPDSDFFTT